MSETKNPRSQPPVWVVVVALLFWILTGKLPPGMQQGAGSAKASTAPTQASAKSSPPVPATRIPKEAKAPPVSSPGTSLAAASPKEALSKLAEWDRPYAVKVSVQEGPAPRRGPLFGALDEASLHPSYQAAFELCQLYDPGNFSAQEVRTQAIDAFFQTVAPMRPIQEALAATGTQLKDLKRNWFGQGRGFEHVICGEMGGPPDNRKLGGYHFWYLHARYEKLGSARYLGEAYSGRNRRQGLADSGIVTGNFDWDPDGSGGLPLLAKKPKGGFSVGHSVAPLLALGHLILETPALKAQRSVQADLNGRTYSWVFYASDADQSLRTLYPTLS